MTKVGTPLKRIDDLSGYDAIVIGSGLGGLCSAALLSKLGKKVLVLEKHYVPGGFTHVFKRKDYEWDVGIHYIGEVHKEFTFIRQLFDYITEGRLEWQEMDPVYDRVILGENSYDFEAGEEKFVSMLKERFPKEHEAIDRYVQLVKESGKQGKNFFKERAFNPFMSALFGWYMRGSYHKYSDRTTKEVLDELTDDPELKAVLAGQYGDYGLPPSESSFAMQAVVNKHYWRGGAFPVGGCERIAQSIAPTIEAAGGLIALRAGVMRIITDGMRATGVELEDGRTVMAPIIISNAGYLNTFGHLLDNKVRQTAGYSPVTAPRPSVAHVCLYIGLKHDLRSLGIGSTNYWVYPHNDHDRGVREYLNDRDRPFPITYISFPSTKDPEWAKRYPGKGTIEMITLAPYEWFSKWEDARWQHRGEEYEALKKYYAQRLLKELYRQFPQLEGKIDYYELSTPLSTKEFVNYSKGEIYGLDHGPTRFRNRNLRAHTSVKGLYLTGQDIVTCGIGGALMGGLITAAAISRKMTIIETIRAEAEKIQHAKRDRSAN
jgi:all-trans-retinol 13,14-reductase